MDKTSIIEQAVHALMDDHQEYAETLIRVEYPHTPLAIESRSYTTSQKMEQFCRDGFLDRYTGERLLNPGILKTISFYLPNDFPYHPHWKTTDTHIAYWELVPTIDHIEPIAKGGADTPSNWATTSMKNNTIKSIWSLEDLQWTLHPAGNMNDWDGLTNLLLQMVHKNPILLKDNYIKQWYHVSMAYIDQIP